jgi:hypothetical protein
MSDTLARWHQLRQPEKEEAPEPRQNEHEQRALANMQREAKQAGATLANEGKGGLPSSLVLHVMRRDRYQCKVCGGKDSIGVHHKGGIVASKWLSQKGHENTPDNLVVICDDCHDNVHEDAREEGIDSSQVTPEGDKERGNAE